MGKPLTKEKLRELASSLGLALVEKTEGNIDADAPKTEGSDLLAFLADRNLDSIEKIEAALSAPDETAEHAAAVRDNFQQYLTVMEDEGVYSIESLHARLRAAPRTDSPDAPPTMMLSAADSAEFLCLIVLYRAGHVTHETVREWELWRDRHGAV